MSNSRVMWIGTIAPSDASAGTNVAKTGIIVGVGQEVGQGDAARLKACEAVGVAVENTVNMVQVPTGRTEIKTRKYYIFILN